MTVDEIAMMMMIMMMMVRNSREFSVKPSSS
jgi:hypothetical protein